MLAIAAISLLIMFVELSWPLGLEAPGAREPTLPSRPASTEAWRPAPLAHYEALTARPLFTADRRPYEPPPEPPVPVEPPGPRVELDVTAIVTSASARLALLRSNVSPDVRKLSVDQTIDGWTLVEIRTDEVVLRKGDEQIVVALQKNPADAASAQRGRTGRARARQDN